MSPDQRSRSFNLALRPDHYKTVLPKFSYPYQPIAPIPWSGYSGPLLFSVSLAVRVLPLPYFFCSQKTTRAETRLTIAASIPIIQVSCLFFPRFNSDTDVKTLTLHQFQVPIPTTASTSFDTSSLVPGALHRVGMLLWVSLIGILYAFVY
jgi:hypothetical protein